LILVLTPSLDGYDGISAASRLVVSALDSDARDVEVWSLAGRAPHDLSKAVGFRSAGGRRGAMGIWSLARATRASRNALVVIMHVHLAPIGLALAMRGARLAFFLHGVEVWRPLRWRERVALDRASLVMANSRWTADQFKAANPSFADVDVAVCHLGVAPRTAPPQLPPLRDYALIVGRLSAEERYKGHDQLIEVWRDVMREAPAARLVIVGDGDDRPRLEAAVRERGLSGAVHFAGRVTDAELEGWYRNAAYFAMPSGGEGFGLAYLEAMRAGKPCVCGPGAPTEIVVDGRTGAVVDPSDRAALTRALVRLFSEESRSAMGQAAADRVAERFESRHFAERFLNLLPPTGAAPTPAGRVEPARDRV
jgi:phosphatidylinositol alpha-1,6-mannosyltransferase